MNGTQTAIDPSEMMERYRRDGVVVLRHFLDAAYAVEIAASWNELRAEVQRGALGRNARFLFGELPRPRGADLPASAADGIWRARCSGPTSPFA